jgi:CRP/FNR family transcriptional regulator, polysaccharide utilization system transcription regulator
MQNINSYIELCLEEPLSLFRGLSQKEKEAIIMHHTVARIKKGEYLFREGEKARGLIYLVTGKAKVFRTGVAGREHIMKMLKDQDITGLQTLFTQSIWSSSGVAIEECIICTIEKQCLLRILRGNAEISIRISRVLSEELSYTYDKMISLSQKHVRGRLVESLLMLCKIYGFEDDGKTIRATLSRNDLAHLSNMTTSNAIRTLSILVSEGNIKLKGRKITILNFGNLQRISEQA